MVKRTSARQKARRQSLDNRGDTILTEGTVTRSPETNAAFFSVRFHELAPLPRSTIIPKERRLTRYTRRCRHADLRREIRLLCISGALLLLLLLVVLLLPRSDRWSSLDATTSPLISKSSRFDLVRKRRFPPLEIQRLSLTRYSGTAGVCCPEAPPALPRAGPAHSSERCLHR